MPIETITVQYVNQPRGNSKKGTIKSSDGRYFGVWPDKLSLFEANHSYTIEFDQEQYQGKTYNQFTRIVDGANGSAAPATRQTTSQRADTKSVEMAVMGIVGRALQGSGTVPSQAHLCEMMDNVRTAWLWAFSDKKTPPEPVDPYQAPDLPDDEVPF